jgi:glycosyltransferase involved in cell wall biosynthesis
MTSQQPEMRNAPAVSVIIPAYQTAAYIAQTLDSVLAQTFRDYEIILVNDGSPDTPELERVLQPYMKDIVYIKQPNGGLAQARNSGIRASRAPFLALLDSDDYWEPDYLAEQMTVLAENSTLDAVYPNALVFGDPEKEGRTYMDDFPSEGEVTFLSLVSGRCNVMGPGVMMRRSALEQVGLYDPEIRHAEDFDLWLRFVKKGGRIAYHRRTLYHLRSRPGSLSRQTLAMHESVLKILDKNEKLFQLTPEESEAVQGARRRITASLQLERGRKAFYDGNFEAAIRDFRDANEYYQRWKLRLVLALLKTAPAPLRRMAQLRTRWRS